MKTTLAVNFETRQIHCGISPLDTVRRWLDSIEVRDSKIACFLCKLIPAYCPFERDIKLFGHILFHLPPLCKLNPLYEQLVSLRFRALCYLADEYEQMAMVNHPICT